MIVTSRSYAEEHGLPILAEIGAAGAGRRPRPVPAVPAVQRHRQALKKEQLEPGDVDLFEINEAFAQVAIQSMRELEAPADKVNVNGGAISLGHPIGMWEPVSRSHSPWSCSVVAAASVSPACAVAAAKATR